MYIQVLEECKALMKDVLAENKADMINILALKNKGEIRGPE